MTTMRFLNICRCLALAVFSAMLTMCTQSVPDNAEAVDAAASIMPDYSDVTVPCNIAPLNFAILEPGEAYVTHIYPTGGDGVTLSGRTVDIDASKWRQMLEQARNSCLNVDIYVKKTGKWLKYKPFTIEVADEIDSYISYRLIEPSYVNYEVMRINQRCLENFDEDEIFNNCAFSNDENGQCINCHSYQNYNAGGVMQMHVRGNKGGTLIVSDGKVSKVDLNRPGSISPGVYPAWHPSLKLVAYSNNLTHQLFHSADVNKIEVYDNESDLMFYDVDNDRLSVIANDSTELETFPSWSPDGATLYYASASIPAMTADQRSKYAFTNYKDLKYDIYSRAFDQQTRKFSDADTVFRASAIGKSAVLPRISPDGKYMLFSMAEYGNFHIWHHDADLYVMNLATSEVTPLANVNSPDTESYHSWSSNGRWILFSSRRDDGSYTRLYIAYFGEDGKARKPFMLPQRNPESNAALYKSYNVPEFMVAPVQVSRKQIIEAIN